MQNIEAQTIYLEIADVSQAIGISESKLRLRVKKGLIAPSARTVRGGALFTPTDAQHLRELMRQEANRARATKAR